MDGHKVRLFASRHLQDISGIVLIDPSVENQVPILERAAPAIAENDKNSMGFIRYCANPDRSAEARGALRSTGSRDLSVGLGGSVRGELRPSVLPDVPFGSGILPDRRLSARWR